MTVLFKAGDRVRCIDDVASFQDDGVKNLVIGRIYTVTRDQGYEGAELWIHEASMRHSWKVKRFVRADNNFTDYDEGGVV